MPDDAHPFGSGKEVYFWTLIVAILVCAVGGGVSIFGGLQGLLHPRPIVDPAWNYVVLGVALMCCSRWKFSSVRSSRREMSRSR